MFTARDIPGVNNHMHGTKEGEVIYLVTKVTKENFFCMCQGMQNLKLHVS